MMASDDFEYCVDGVFHLTGRDAPVVTGELKAGHVAIGDEVVVVHPNGCETERGKVVSLDFFGGADGRFGLMIGGAATRMLAPGAVIRAPRGEHL